ncbi:sugar phosphate isomerase/epimerase [Lacihabitans sp. CCS-44]|uniref:sugar phosphate isomerase/epimerase family protein n=1 Tax=Lacihabitans sp. CCS-44 TaxID=2487331 RepID=UPI0020CBC815|nr:sugar phosphate isomerase/epimerase [Lacihabitans sp. CCS-44]
MKNKIGMNLLLWGTEIDERLFPVLEQIKQIGYDGVEIPIFNTNPEHWYTWRKKLDELGLARIAVTINGPGESFISSDPAERKSTLERNKLALDCAMILGSDLLTGPFHSALGVFTGSKATSQEKLWAKEGLWDLAEYADSLGITLGLEYLNRFESYLVSCSDELLDLVNYVNHPACKIMFDTFHANIEEKSMSEAIKKIGEKLVHVQLSENDRGTLGQGRVEIPEVLEALKGINYEGMLSIEAFSEKLSAANIWRKMFESEEQLMKDSYEYLKTII